MSTKEHYLSILVNNLSNESKWFLLALRKEKKPLHKEELRDVANLMYQNQQGLDINDALISSRHGLDIHTARLEGAGLVEVREIGRVRIYSLTELAQELIEFLKTK